MVSRPAIGLTTDTRRGGCKTYRAQEIICIAIIADVQEVVKMKKYDYREAVKADIREWLQENRGLDELKEELKDDFDRVIHDLYDELFCEDSITGNASGSYACDRWQAEENLCHNLGLLSEVHREFGVEPDLDDPEGCDVTIRCYLLEDCLWSVLYGVLHA